MEPLTAGLRQLHLAGSARLLDKVARARDGLSHANPGATTEQVLEAALDLLLERQARRMALVKRPRQPAGSVEGSSAAPAPVAASRTLAGPRRPHIPAAIEREMRLRHGGRCQHPLDAGGVCGSTWQVELDHLLPLALGGATTAANLRYACRRHNAIAAEEALGPAGSARRR